MKKNNYLPPAYQKIYEKFYLDYALSSTKSRKLASLLESWYHRRVAYVRSNHISTILEIGAGSLAILPMRNHTNMMLLSQKVPFGRF